MYSPRKTQTQPQPAHRTAVCCAQESCVCILNSPRISSVVSVLHPFTASVSEWMVYQQMDAWACSRLHLPATHCAWKYLEEPTVGTEMSPLPQRCFAQGAREKQPNWCDRLVLRHLQTSRVQGLGRQPRLHRGQGGRERRRHRQCKCTSKD